MNNTINDSSNSTDSITPEYDLVVGLSVFELYKSTHGEYKLIVENKYFIDVLLTEQCGDKNCFYFYSNDRTKYVRIIFNDKENVHIEIRTMSNGDPYNWLEHKYTVKIRTEKWQRCFDEMNAYKKWVQESYRAQQLV
jgi:hypothetical protein